MYYDAIKEKDHAIPGGASAATSDPQPSREAGATVPQSAGRTTPPALVVPDSATTYANTIFSASSTPTTGSALLPPEWQACLKDISDVSTPPASLSALSFRLAELLGLKTALNNRLAAEEPPMDLLQFWQRGEGPVVLVPQAEPGTYQLDMTGLLHALHACRNVYPLEVRLEAAEAIKSLLAAHPDRYRADEPTAQPGEVAGSTVPKADAVAAGADASGSAGVAGADHPPQWQATRQQLGRQLGEMMGLHEALNSHALHHIIMDMPHLEKKGDGGVREKQLKDIRRDPAFFALLANYVEHGVENHKLFTSLVDALDSQIRLDGHVLPMIEARDVEVLLPGSRRAAHGPAAVLATR